MNPFYDNGDAILFNGDCREVLAELPEACVDTVITDPPYGLEFMGKGWDKGVPGVEFWEAVLRVAKPGAMLLAFGGTRTYHRLACAIEDAGWELRDCLMWLYGTGFPKSHDVSKAIDKNAGHWRGRAGKIKTGNAAMSGPNYERAPKGDPVTAAATVWNGWGTALKPAWEPIILAMKPIDGTFASNALTHDVAGLNVDAARVPLAGEAPPTGSGKGSKNSKFEQVRRSKGNGGNATPDKGRWPANVVLDEEAAAMLDEQSGKSKSRAARSTKPDPNYKNKVYDRGMGGIVSERNQHTDEGGASRFFYCAKAGKREREGNDHPTVKPVALMRWLCRLTGTPTGGVVLDPFTGSGSTGVAALTEGREFVGVELDEHYAEIAAKRLGDWSATK